jgi:hypothetical protein
MLYSSFETGRQPAFGGEAAKAGKQVESTASKRRKIVRRCVTRSTPLATPSLPLDRGYRMFSRTSRKPAQLTGLSASLVPDSARRGQMRIDDALGLRHDFFLITFFQIGWTVS